MARGFGPVQGPSDQPRVQRRTTPRRSFDPQALPGAVREEAANVDKKRKEKRNAPLLFFPLLQRWSYVLFLCLIFVLLEVVHTNSPQDYVHKVGDDPGGLRSFSDRFYTSKALTETRRVYPDPRRVQTYRCHANVVFASVPIGLWVAQADLPRLRGSPRSLPRLWAVAKEVTRGELAFLLVASCFFRHGGRYGKQEAPHVGGGVLGLPPCTS